MSDESLPLSRHDQSPAAYRTGEVYEVSPGQTGGIHDHETVTGRNYRHSHAGWNTPHRHLRNDVHPFEPSTDTVERRGTRPACAICGNAERDTIHSS